MALKKSIAFNSGLTMEYHRIISLSVDNNMQTIVVASYQSEAQREFEQTRERCLAPIHTETTRLTFEQSTAMSISRAYELLKQHELFEGAEDLLDEGQLDEVTGEEFISMIEEVL